MGLSAGAMQSYVLIESRDPFDGVDPGRLCELAVSLAEDADVTVFMIQNGVLAARRGSIAETTVRSLVATTTVLADDFSLRQRAIQAAELVNGVEPAGVDTLVDLVADGTAKTIWM